MSPYAINTSYTIPGCRNGEPVTKIVFITGMGGSGCYRYSDGLMLNPTTPDDTGWTEGDCAHYDAETTCVAENGNLYYIRFDTVTNTYRVYDFAGVDVTGTVTPIECTSGGDVTSEAELVCDSGTELYRFAVVVNGVPSGVVYYTDVNTGAIVVPSGPVTAGACPTAAATIVAEGDYEVFTNISTPTAVTMPAFDVTELEIYADNTGASFEVIMTTSLGGNIVHLVPISASTSKYRISLLPSEGFITSLSIDPSALIANVVVNFYGN